jgi:hypothetical protein
MSDYNWCHGPNCHTHKTQDRIRGVKGSKVLRTKKITINKWNTDSVWSYFCSQGCWNDFMHKHYREFIALHPRTECLETPIEVEKEKYESSRYNWNGENGPERVPYMATRTTIKSVDNA